MSALLSMREHFVREEKPLNVLVLDDDRFDRKRIARLAASSGSHSVTITEAADLESLIAQAQSARFDLVFVDFFLADGNGLDALDHLFASSANVAAYTVMVSGIEAPDAKATCLARGCDLYFEKSQLSKEVLHTILNAARTAPTTARGTQSDSAVMDYWAARARRRHVASATRHAGKLDSNWPRQVEHEGRDLKNGVQVNGSTKDPQGFLTEFFEDDEFQFGWLHSD